MKIISLVCAAWVFALSLHAQTTFVEKIDRSLFVQSSNGYFRADLSGLLDLEGYYVDRRAPGLLFLDRSFFNPRLSLFVDAHAGKHFYAFVQTRFDRGIDPGVKPDGDARVDEYFLRYIPFDDARLNLQFGKFATVVGNFIPRHDSWHNPLITAPLPYENIVTISDGAAPKTPAEFLARRDKPDQKRKWLPLLWGPVYTSGGAILGSIEKFDYAAEFKNASISSRPAVWDATDLGWENPTISGRVGYRPNATWNFGVSASGGSYLLPGASGTLPAGTGLSDYKQLTIGHDVGYAHGHWQVWGEVFASRFEVPNVGDADAVAYYLETKYKFTTKFFGALRWNQQLFGEVNNGLGGSEPWDRDAWRIDAAVGYRFDRHAQAKLQYSYNHQDSPLQQGEQLVAAQLTLKF
jgi:hypothetical protein